MKFGNVTLYDSLFDKVLLSFTNLIQSGCGEFGTREKAREGRRWNGSLRAVSFGEGGAAEVGVGEVLVGEIGVGGIGVGEVGITKIQSHLWIIFTPFIPDRNAMF